MHTSYFTYRILSGDALSSNIEDTPSLLRQRLDSAKSLNDCLTWTWLNGHSDRGVHRRFWLKRQMAATDYVLILENWIPWPYSLPHVSEILDRLGKFFFFPKIDLNDFFLASSVIQKSREKTAFSVHGLFQFKRLPFGLDNSAQCCQRLMGALFGSTDYKVLSHISTT